MENAWTGAGLKFAVAMTCEGFSMDEDDWTITVRRGGNAIRFTKGNSVQEDGQWFICVDTSLLGPGMADIIFDAVVPDDDFEGGVRHEIQKHKFINIQQP